MKKNYFYQILKAVWKQIVGTIFTLVIIVIGGEYVKTSIITTIVNSVMMSQLESSNFALKDVMFIQTVGQCFDVIRIALFLAVLFVGVAFVIINARRAFEKFLKEDLDEENL